MCTTNMHTTQHNTKNCDTLSHAIYEYFSIHFRLVHWAVLRDACSHMRVHFFHFFPCVCVFLPPGFINGDSFMVWIFSDKLDCPCERFSEFFWQHRNHPRTHRRYDDDAEWNISCHCMAQQYARFVQSVEDKSACKVNASICSRSVLIFRIHSENIST